MGFKDLTRQRKKYLEEKEKEVLELKLLEVKLLLKYQHSTAVLKNLAQEEMSHAELREIASLSSLYRFLKSARELGVIERYYNKKMNNYYYRLIPKQIKITLG